MVGEVLTLADLRAFLETIPREFLVAMADTAEREDRIEILERENERLREHRCRVSGHDLAREWLKGFDE